VVGRTGEMHVTIITSWESHEIVLNDGKIGEQNQANVGKNI